MISQKEVRAYAYELWQDACQGDHMIIDSIFQKLLALRGLVGRSKHGWRSDLYNELDFLIKIEIKREWSE